MCGAVRGVADGIRRDRCDGHVRARVLHCLARRICVVVDHHRVRGGRRHRCRCGAMVCVGGDRCRGRRRPRLASRRLPLAAFADRRCDRGVAAACEHQPVPRCFGDHRRSRHGVPRHRRPGASQPGRASAGPLERRRHDAADRAGGGGHRHRRFAGELEAADGKRPAPGRARPAPRRRHDGGSGDPPRRCCRAR
jgi:hypothetical protein